MTVTEQPAPPPRRVVRLPDRGWLGGVCAGLSDHLGVPPTALRAGLIVLASWRLVGVAAYFLLWLFLPRDTDQVEAPGLAAASRRGLRGRATVRVRPSLWALGQALALVMLGGGLTWLVQAMDWGLPGAWHAAGALFAAGTALVWWQADHASTSSIDQTGGPFWWLEPLVTHWSTVLALIVGLLSVALSVGMVAAMLPFVGDVGRMLWAIVLSLISLGTLAAPWLLRVRRSLAVAREQRLISDARADMAAHLHDSVLQTLALIQRQAADQREVVRLARRQERELREWLYGGEAPVATLKSALEAAAQDVEDSFPVTVECVTVGELELSPRLAELVRGTREAMWNAAKHSGAAHVDVYAEVGDTAVEIFVRDRGRGFDPEAIGDDRMGIRRSIMERVQRHHGTAEIRSSAEQGTEVRLEMAL